MTSRRLRYDPPIWLAKVWYWGGIVGVFLGIMAMIASWLLLSSFGRSTSETLDLLTTTLATTVDGATTALETLALAEEGMIQAETALAAAGSGLTQMSDVLDNTASLLSADVPDTLDSITASFPGMIDTARVIDRTMNALSFLGIEYSPAIPLDQSLGAVADDLAPLSEELRAQSAPLAAAANQLSVVGGAVDEVGESVRLITDELSGSRDLLTSYQDAANDANRIVAEVTASFDRQILIARILLVAIGMMAIVMMSVPIVLGKRELEEVLIEQEIEMSEASAVQISDQKSGPRLDM
ncbi:MAG: hypothetical protein ABR609_10525 [Acidimicrobiia bacterium]